MKKYLLGVLMVCVVEAFAQSTVPAIKRVEPLSWWIGMKNHSVQLLIYGDKIGTTTLSVDYPGITVDKITKGESENYLFADLTIGANTQPGLVTLSFDYGKKKKLTHTWPLLARQANPQAFQGLTSADVIYLITPDRFANGDPSNDAVKGLKEGVNRSFHGDRHGGDVAGIISKIDYMHDLGVTALWSSPVCENDMKEYSYHGYAITDYYKVDARMGTNNQYKQLADKLHTKGMKLVMDMVFNHCGLEHWWMKDMPFADWIHDYPGYSITNYSISSLSDPHAAQADARQMERGWFVSQMPDLNHDNPFMARYLIQNSIWWIEYAGLDGIRMDTYPYNKKEFMAEWAKQVYAEYPKFYLVGETWIGDELTEAFWTARNTIQLGGFNSHTKSMTDFPLTFSMHKAFGKDGDVMHLYSTLAKDFIYENPDDLKIFVDNHDMDRMFFQFGEDIKRYKLALAFMLTTRGIPQFYYGTEILMKGHGDHGFIREDFPGGWATDTRNAFTKEGRTPQENEAYDYVRKLLNWRKQSDAIQHGSLKHFIPYNNVYVYARTSEKESVVVVINNTGEDKAVDMTRYKELIQDASKGLDVITGENISNLNTIPVNSRSARIIQLGSDTDNKLN